MSLSSIRSRLEAATPGPWTAPNTGHLIDSSAGTVLAMVDKADGLMTPADAAFIAHARQDIPALLRVAEAAAKLATVHEDTAETTASGSSSLEDLTDALAQRAKAWAGVLTALSELEALP